MKNGETIINAFWGAWDRKSIVSSLLYFAGASLLFLILYAIQSYNYLLFHSIVEIISAFSSFIIFIIVLTVWKHLENDRYLCFLGIAFFFTGLIDVVHMLAYRGMSIFDGSDGNLPTQLWIVARYIQAFSLLIAGMLIKTNYQMNKYILFLIYTVIVSFAFATIFYWTIFPDCFIEGTGLTPFKIQSEYIICILFIMSIIMIVKRKNFFNKEILRFLVISISFQVIAELAFTIDINVYAFANFLGHYIKIIAVVLFCKAILTTAIGNPIKLLFGKLEKRQMQLKKAQRIGNMGSWELDLITGDFTWSNQTILILEYDKKIMKFSYPVFLEMVHPDDCENRKNNFITAIENHGVYNSIHRLILLNGKTKIVHERGELSYDEENNPEKMNCIIRDITEQKKNEEEILRLNIDLEKMVMERTIQLEEMNCELEATNATLEEEISERQKGEERIYKLNEELEDKVNERTSQLDEVNNVLDASNTLLSAILNSSPEIIVFSLDVNYCYLTFNIRYQENMRVLWGKNIKIGMSFLEVIGNDEETVQNAERNFQRVLAGESFILVEEYSDKKDMRLFSQNYWSPIFSSDGRITGITCFVMDITQTKLLHERLEKYQILAEKANDVMMFIDEECHIIEVNDAATRMYGYTFEEFLGMTVYDLRGIKKTPEINEQIRLAHQNGIIFETCHYRKDGTTIQVEVSSYKNILGKTEGLLSIVRDVTERKKAQEEIMIALKKAEEANHAKGQFLANMSHEIRTPMNGIIGMTELTLMTDLAADQREYLNIVKSSTISLLRVVNDILDYSKIEAGKIDLEKVPFDLRQTVNEVMDLFEISAKQKGLSIIGNIDELVPEQIIGDSVRLRQILSNLVGNAVKFTEQGEVSIHVHLAEKYYNKVKLRFVIIDTGMGIPHDKLGKLFKRFSQVDESNTRRFGGTGLGLAISKKLIEIMDGEIGVESEEDVGSRFFFTAIFELSEHDLQIASEDSYHSELEHYEQQVTKKILLAEDDTVSRNMLSIVLEREGYTVVSTENGIQAVSAFEKEKFDIILMDVNMPYLDGYSATATIRLKEKDTNSRTPIIAITAYALKGDREKCLKADMDDYISKPINFGEVVGMIQKYLQGGKDKNQVVSKNAFIKTVEDLMEASGFDKETSISIITDFCGQALRILQEIQKCISENKLEGVRILIHQLKGSAGNVRAKEIAQRALAAEEAMRELDEKALSGLLEEIEQRVEDLVRNSKEG